MNLAMGKNIKKLREIRNVTQEQLAKALNISYQAVSKWENEVAIPDTVMLPQIAKFFQVTIDDLFQTGVKTYPNIASRYLAIYECSHRQEDFFQADREFSKLIASEEYTEEDLRSYGVLYEYHTYYCIKKALDLYQKVLDFGASSKSDTYYKTQRQQIVMLTKIGRGKESIENQIKQKEKEQDNVQSYIALISAYYYNNEFNNALEVFQNALLKWQDNELIYVYGGDIYKKLKDYDKAFFYWNKSLSINDDYADAMYSKAFCYQELGDKENESKMWKQIIEWLEKRGLIIEAEWPKKMLQDIDRKN